MKNNFTEALKKLTGFDGLSDQSEETEIKDEPLEESTEVFVDAKQEELSIGNFAVTAVLQCALGAYHSDKQKYGNYG